VAPRDLFERAASHEALSPSVERERCDQQQNYKEAIARRYLNNHATVIAGIGASDAGREQGAVGFAPFRATATEIGRTVPEDQV
jgi:hypothetical protein